MLVVPIAFFHSSTKTNSMRSALSAQLCPTTPGVLRQETTMQMAFGKIVHVSCATFYAALTLTVQHNTV